MYYLRKTGEPPQTKRQRWLKAGILAASMGIVPATGLAATIQGNFFNDANGNSLKDAGESVRPNEILFIHNNTLAEKGQGGSFTAMTDANGGYSSGGHSAGSFTVWAAIPEGWTQTVPKAGEGIVFYTFNLAANETKKMDFGFREPPPNQAPKAFVGDANLTVNAGEIIHFTAIVNDPEGDATPIFGWNFGDGNKADNTLEVDHAYNVPGVYTAVFSVEDEQGAKGTANVTVTVENVNPAANIKINPATIKKGQPVTFTAEVTDPGENTHTYRWSFGDGTTSTDMTAVHTYTAGGSYQVKLSVRDNYGSFGTAITTIVIDNATPVVDAGADVTVAVGETVNFKGNYSDADEGDIHTFKWKFANGKLAKTPEASTSYTAEGNYVVTFTVTDDQGGVGMDTLTVTVNGAPPVVNATANATVVNVGQTVTFNGSFTDVDGGTPSHFLWVFGDGNAATGEVTDANAVNATHTFTQSGDFTAVLQITDSDGNKGKAEIALHVRGIDDNPCDPAITTLQSDVAWPGTWTTSATWKPNRVPNENDWVLIKKDQTVILPLKGNGINVKGLCIESGGILQGYAISNVNISAATVHNKGTIQAGDGTNGSGSLASNYAHGSAGGHIKILAYKVVNDGAIGPTKTNMMGVGNGGDDHPYRFLPNGTRMNALGGAAGQIDIHSAIMLNHGRIEGGKGGNAYGNEYAAAHGKNGYFTKGPQTKYVRGGATGGKGGSVIVTATLLDKSESTGKLKAGCGGHAFGQRNSTYPIAWLRSIAGKGGNVTANMKTVSKVQGCNGNSAHWDPIMLKATPNTSFDGFENVTIFGGENASLDLTQLSEGAISASGTITIAVGPGGKVDLRGLHHQAFKAGVKLEIFADEILLDEGLAPADLVDAPSVVVSSSKIIYHAEMSYENHLVGEPNAAVPVKLTLINGGPTEDSYTLSVTDSAGWPLGHLPATVTVNSMRRSDLILNVTLPATRGQEDTITVTATSENDPNVVAVAEISVSVVEEEIITPRGDEKVDMALLIDNTMMAGEVIMLSNMLEAVLANPTGQEIPPAEEGLTGEELDQLTDEQLEQWLAAIEVEEINWPLMELITFTNNVTSRVVTDNLGEIISRLRRLQPETSGGCPTTTVAALESALDNLNPNGQIFLVTSASPQGDMAAAIAKAQALGVQVHVLLSGSCGDEVTDEAVYQDLAEQTGGDFNQVPQREMPAVEEIEQVVGQVINEVIEMVENRGNGNDTDEPPVTPATCMVYGVHDEGLNDSIFFAIDFETEEATQLGPIYNGYDIEAMTVSRDANILYVASGNDTEGHPKGHLYYLDANTGELVAIGATGFEEIGGLAFAGDGTLWAWAKGDGLVQLNPVTGQGTLVIPTPALLEDLTATRDGTMLYGSLEDQLWSYDPTTDTLTMECDNLERETEAVEFLLDGLLLLGRNGETSLMLQGFDIATCSMVANRNIKAPFNDVEGLAVPHAACLR